MSRRVVGNQAILAIDGLSLVIGAYGIYTNILYQELPAHLSGGGHWQFLTNLSLAYSMVVFGLGFIAHLTRNQFLFNLKNDVHPIGIALESIVTLVYWPLRIWFLHLLVHDTSAVRINLSTDLAIHLMPVTSLLVDYLFFMPRWTIKNSTALIVCALLTVAYWFLLKQLIDFENGGMYPYAFMNVESDHIRAIMFLIVGITGFSQFLILRKFYDFIVGITEEAEAEIDRQLSKKNE